MERVLVPVAMLIATVSLVGGIVWLVRHFEKKRTEALRAVAAAMGLDFSAGKDETMLAKMEVFSLFHKGHGRRMKNVMTTTADTARITIFDYQYTTGGGQHSQTHRQTVVSIESDALSLPNFALRPEGVMQKIGAALGMQDIDFEGDPEFSNAFVLTGDDEESIRRFFDEELRESLAQRKGICVEVTPGLFIYHCGGRRKPEEIRELMNEAWTVHSACAARLSRMPAPSV